MKAFFQREALTPALFDEMLPLLQDHWKAIAHYQDIPLSPAIDVYLASQAADILRVYTLRDADAHYRLEGYAVFFVRPNPHYSGSLQAAQDILYINPASRLGMTGIKFIKWCDEQLREDGVQAVYHHSKVQHDFGKILTRLGYEAVDIIYARRLD
jgi:hypothetical protein